MAKDFIFRVKKGEALPPRDPGGTRIIFDETEKKMKLLGSGGEVKNLIEDVENSIPRLKEGPIKFDKDRVYGSHLEPLDELEFDMSGAKIDSKVKIYYVGGAPALPLGWEMISPQMARTVGNQIGTVGNQIGTIILASYTDENRVEVETRSFKPPVKFFPMSNTTENPVSEDYISYSYTFIPNEGIYFDVAPDSFAYLFKSKDNFSGDPDMANWDVSNIEDMTGMLYNNSMFNQDLSKWCVSLIRSKPVDFDVGTTSWTLPSSKPVWGSCPQERIGVIPKT